MRAVTRGALVQAFALESAIPDGFVDYTRASLALPGTRHAMVRESQRDDPSLLRPSRVAQPSLVVHGADDYVVPFSVGEDLHAKLPESSFVPVLSGSHMLPITHPELLGREIHDFVGAY